MKDLVIALSVVLLIPTMYLFYQGFKEQQLRKIDKILRVSSIDWVKNFEQFLRRNQAADKFDKVISRQHPWDYKRWFRITMQTGSLFNVLERLIDYEEDPFWVELNKKWNDHILNIFNNL